MKFGRIISKLKFEKKIIKNQKILAEMHLTCERNRQFLKIRNSAELIKLSVEFADNSTEFFKNSATDYRPV
jgi:hypothetical protein